MKKAVATVCGALAALVLLGAFFRSPLGRAPWLLTVFPAMVALDAAVHLPFNPWHLFSASETIVLSDESGPDPDVAGSAARAREMAKLWYLVGKYKDVDDSVDIIDPGSGRTVEIVCRTWHPSDSRDLARTFRRLYERMPEEEGIADAAGFVAANAWGALDIEPSVRLPPPSDAPYAPVLDATARSLAARGPRDAARMVEIAADHVWLTDPYPVHVLLCRVLRVPDAPATNECYGMRVGVDGPSPEPRLDCVVPIRDAWRNYRDELSRDAPAALREPYSEPSTTELRRVGGRGIPVAPYPPERLFEGERPRHADFYGFLVTTNGAERIYARADETGQSILPCRQDPAPERIACGASTGVLVEVAPGATDEALDELLSRIDCVLPSRVHVFPEISLRAPKTQAAAVAVPAASESHADAAETADPNPHAESADGAKEPAP